MSVSFLDEAIAKARERTALPAVRAQGGGMPFDAAGPGLALFGTSSTEAHAEQYRHFNGWNFAAIRAIAQKIAGQPLRVARKVKPPDFSKARGWRKRKWERERTVRAMTLRAKLPVSFKHFSEELELLESHPLVETLARPNRIMTRFMVIYVTVASLELTGKAYWWIVDVDGKPQLWPLPASWVRERHDKGFFGSWDVYFNGVGQPVEVPADQIGYIYYPSPASPLAATSPMQAQARAVVADEAISEAQRRSFINGHMPGLAVKIGRHPDINGVPGQRPHLTDDQKREILTNLNQAYRGVANTDKAIILDGWVEEVFRLSNTNREMDYLTSSKLTKERITQGFGVNPVVMGQLEDTNRASALVATDNFHETCINPKIALISECLTQFVVPLFGASDESLIAFIEEAKTEDADYNLRLEESLYRNYAMNRNEWRQRHGLVPIQGGETCIGAFGEVPVLRTDEELDPDADYPIMNAEPETPAESAAEKLLDWFERKAHALKRDRKTRKLKKGLSKLSEVEPHANGSPA